LVFARPPEQDYCWLRMPVRLPDGSAVRSVRAAASGGGRPCRVLAVSSNDMALLVNCAGLPAGSPVAVYAITNGPQAAPDAPFCDPLPVEVIVRRAGGHGAPPSWSNVVFLANRRAPQVVFRLPAFEPVASESPHAWHKGGWERPTYLAQFRSWLVVAAAGVYRFGVRGEFGTYLLVDGQVVAQQADAREDDLSPGREVYLAAGLHRIEVFTIGEHRLRVGVAWMQPGRSSWESLPAACLAAGAAPVPTRFEQLGKVLHAAASWTLAPSYRFCDSPVQFTPVRFDSLHANWEGGSNVTCEWFFRGRSLGRGASLRHVFAEIGLLPVELRLRNALGIRSATVLLVDVPERASSEYRVAAGLVGLPAVCYEDDAVRPEIHVRSTVPTEVPLEARAILVRSDGREETVAAAVAIDRTWGRLVLPAGHARDLLSVSWEIDHAGVAVARGRLRLLRPPFAALPAGLDGDLLLCDGDPCVLVPRQGSRGVVETTAAVRPGQRLVILDGFSGEGSPPADDLSGFDRRLLDSLAAAFHGGGATNDLRYQRITFSTLLAPLQSQGYDRLAPLARVGECRDADVVVVAPDCAAARSGTETPAEFERRLAALVGLLRDGVGAEVVLVTPPPGNPSATDGNADPGRALAEIVMRVADAGGASVADLYTLCRTSSPASEVPAVLPGDAVRSLAAEAIARLLAGAEAGE
jgi:hypothetical protein